MHVHHSSTRLTQGTAQRVGQLPSRLLWPSSTRLCVRNETDATGILLPQQILIVDSAPSVRSLRGPEHLTPSPKGHERKEGVLRVRQARTAEPTEPISALTTEVARREVARTTVLRSHRPDARDPDLISKRLYFDDASPQISPRLRSLSSCCPVNPIHRFP